MDTITCDAEATSLLDSTSIDYTTIPFKLKDDFRVHCLVVEDHDTGEIFAFYDGPTIKLNGKPHVVEGEHDTYILEDYKPVKYTHYPLNKFRKFIKKNKPKRVVMHNGINYDLLVCKLYFGMDYTVGPDTWDGRDIVIEDTLVTSKCLNADRYGGHSLDNLGRKIGLNKIEFRKNLPEELRFKEFAPDMLYYCIRDVQVNTGVFNMLEMEKEDWEWDGPLSLEKAVKEIITRQEHWGFWFDKNLAEESVIELDALMEERRARVEPELPARPATKKFLSDHTPPANQIKITTVKPPKNQFKGNREPSANLLKFAEKVGGSVIKDDGDWVLELDDEHYELPFTEEVEVSRELAVHMQGFVERHGATVDEKVTQITIFGETHDLPLPREPLKTEMVATIEDTPHIKNWLVGLGWTPTEYSEKDLTTNAKKEKYEGEKLTEAIERYVEQTLSSNFCKDRCEHLKCTPKSLKMKLISRTKDGRGIKVLTNPSFTVGQDKKMCPALERIAEQFPYAQDIVEYLTYRHRRNSILGGNLSWDEESEATKGFLAYVREDGRIPTPADPCGAATSRFRHKIVVNVPRPSSLYGENMRGMFGPDKEKGRVQIGYDFDSLEARMEAHYCWDFDKTKEYCNSLILAKPNDVHTKTAKKIGDILNEEFPRSTAKNVKYGSTYGAQVAKLAKTIGCSYEIAETVFNAFWEAAEPLAKLKAWLEIHWQQVGDKKFIVGIDGRKIPTRAKHALLNSLFQSAGIICAKRAMVYHDRLLGREGLLIDCFRDDWTDEDFVQQMIHNHDEAQLETPKRLVTFKGFDTQEEAEKFKEEAEKVWSDIYEANDRFYVMYTKGGELISKAVELVNKYYNLNVPLTAGYQIGQNWKECH